MQLFDSLEGLYRRNVFNKNPSVMQLSYLVIRLLTFCLLSLLFLSCEKQEKLSPDNAEDQLDKNLEAVWK